MARSNSAFSSDPASLASQALRTFAPRRPAARQGFNASSGTVKGSWPQAMARREAAISSSKRV